MTRPAIDSRFAYPCAIEEANRLPARQAWRKRRVREEGDQDRGVRKLASQECAKVFHWSTDEGRRGVFRRNARNAPCTLQSSEGPSLKRKILKPLQSSCAIGARAPSGALALFFCLLMT